MQGDEELRKDIDLVMAIELPGQFAMAWDELMKMGGHRLRIVGKDETFNCHAHALGICEMPEFRQRYYDGGCKVLAKSDFVANLIERGEIQSVEGQSYRPDNIVIYFKDGRPTHSSRVVETDGLLLSKWGGNELLEHGLWEVPTYYGDQYRVFLAPKPDRMWELLKDWLPRIA